MDGFAAIIAGLDGFSISLGLVIGLVGGFVFAMLTYRSYGNNFRNTFERLSDEIKQSYDGVSDEMKSSFKSLSSEALTSNQRDFLSLADRELNKKTDQHTTELDAKKQLIDQSLQSMSKSMSDTLNTVPTELEKNQKNVSEALDKSTAQLKESNKSYLTQLTEKAETQSEAHSKELESKKALIDQRLTDMDVKLGKVQTLIDEFEKARESKLGALDDQLKNLTQTTSALQRALADNQARGQWGERIAEQILDYLGLRQGVSYLQQSQTPSGTRPDYTFLLPNSLSIHMDCKFPIDNYLRYVEAENDSERSEFTKSFLRNVENHVSAVTERGYIHEGTVDCVLLFIPNEQIYRFIHEEGSAVIDSALQNKVILCSPLTLYIVLAVIRQASENFAIELRSHEILSLLGSIRNEWTKYTDMMDGMGKNFRTLQNKFDALTGTRTRQLDRQFARIDSIASSSNHSEALLSLPEASDGNTPI